MKDSKLIVIFLLFFVFVFCLDSVILSYNDKEYTVTVTDKEKVIIDANDSRYLIYGENENGDSLVFENTDILCRGKFNSSNIQGSIKVDHAYRITVVGYRIPFLSMYENILSVEEVKPE